MENIRTREIAIVVFIAIFFGLVIFFKTVRINPPGINTGFAPEQPLAFSHRLHSGDLQMDCLYCHVGADKGQHALIPAAGTCMNCHRFVTASWDKVKIEEMQAEEEKREMKLIVSPELEKLYQAVGFDTETMRYDEKKKTGELEWVRVYNLPDFVYFDHSRHVNSGVQCQTCHGQVQTMEKVEQVTNLTMGWCVNCHRDVTNNKIPELKGKKPSISCAVCHY